jgi:hypothetical protein
MSNALSNAVYSLDLACTYERHVLARLADRINDKTGVCWPSVATIARELCCSVRKVQGVLKELERRELICVERNAGPKGCNLYRLTLPPAADAPPHLVHPSTAGTQPPQITPGTPARDAPEPKKNPKKNSPRTKSKSASVSESNLTIQAIREGKRWAASGVSAYQARIWISEGKISEQEAREVGLL